METTISQERMETLRCPLCGHDRIRMDNIFNDSGAFAVYLDFSCDRCEEVSRLRIDYVVEDDTFATTARFGERQAVGSSL